MKRPANLISQKSWKVNTIFRLLMVFVLFTMSLSVLGQTYLIPVNAPANQYPITFTDAGQQTLILQFDRAVTSAGTTAGWTVTVGGAPVALAGNPAAAGNFLRITLSSSISYANRNSVLVSYNAGVGTMSLFGAVEPSMTNVQAINNYIADASDFSNGLYGENPPVDICAAVINVEVASNITMSQRFRNSIHYANPRAYIRWTHPVDNPKTQPVYSEIGGAGTGLYYVTATYPAYPDNTINCTWDISIFPYLYNSGTLQPNLFVTQNTVVITIPNYKKDNGTPVPGTGALGLNPPIDDPSTLFCVGDDIVAFIFSDATVFDCQLPVEPDLPNISPRNVQFVYGTHAGAGIPNVFIDVFGTMVQVTDANGDVITGPFNVDAYGNPVAPYATTSGFEGPVIQYLWDNFTKTLITPMATTYPIHHTGDFVNDMANDIFDVTLRNWGPCNPYDGGNPFTSLDAVTEISRLRLIDSPPLPTAPDVTICEGSSTVLTAVRNGAPNPGQLHWYSDIALTTEVATGTTYDPGVVAPGVYTYYVREIAGTTGNCPGPVEDIVLTINEIPNTPTVSRNNPNFCFDGTSSIVLTANPNTPPAIVSYQWYRDGNPAGTGISITLDQVSHSGDYTVRTYGINPTNCPSPLSVPVTVSIDIPPGATTNLTQEYCGDINSSVNLQGNSGGTDLANGATGMWTFPTAYREDFNDLSDGITSDGGANSDWTRAVANTGGGYYSEVRSNRFEMRGRVRTTWTTGIINISALTDVGISLDFSSVAPTGNGFENPQDYYTITYFVDGTPTVMINGNGAVDGTTGGASQPFKTVNLSANGINGNNLYIEAIMYNSANDEFYILDNIVVTEGDSPVITDPTNPISAVTNLPSGATTFTWTVSSVNGVCTPATSTHTVTRWDPPSTANAGTDDSVCEDETTGTINGNIPVFGTGAWTSGGAALVTSPGTATSGVTNLQYGSNTFTWTISNGVCADETDDVIVFRDSPIVPGFLSANHNICENSIPTPFTGTAASGGDGTTYTYQWQYSENSSTGPWTNIGGNTTGFAPGALTTTTWFRRLVSSGNAGCTTQQDVPSTNVIRIGVEPELLPGSISGDQSICLTDDPIAFTSDAPASGGSAPTYQWYHRLNAGAWATLPGETGQVYDAPNTLLQGTHEYYREAISASGTCGPEQTGLVGIVVNPGPTVQINAIAGANSRCEDETIILTYPAVANATEYVWNLSWVVGDVDFTTATPTLTIDLSGYTFASPSEAVTITAAGVNGCNTDPTPGTGDYPWSAAHNLTVYQNPTADAGSGGDECDLNFVLNATASVGTGTWTMTSGSGVANFVPNANTPGATVTVSTYGTKEFTWTEDNGSCVDNDAITVNFYEQPVADAGSGGDECDLDFVLNATASVGTGTWTMTAGSGTASFAPNANSPGATVTVSAYGTKEFTWTEVNGTCSDNDAITVNFYEQPVADAGTGGDECDLNFALNASASVGTGTWTMTTGTGTASFAPNANSPGATVTVSTYGTKEFTWTELNGTCSDNDAITVNFYEQPVADAGTGGDECDLNFVLNATASAGTGTWTMTSGTGTASFAPNANTPGATVTVSTYGTKEFTWTEVNGTCSDNDAITVNFYEQPVADAGSGGDECDLNFVLNATASVGTGTWTMTTGTGTASFAPNANTPGATVTVSTYGTKEFTWTEVNGTCSDNDAVTINFYEQPAANAGTGGNECDLDFSLVATASIGTGTWTMTTGTGVASFVPNANTPGATVTVSAYGTKEFTWTEVNGSCSDNDAVTVNFYEQPVADAGAGGDECDLDFALNATASVGTGTWTMTSGSGIASFAPNANTPGATVTVSQYGAKEFTWTEVNGTCSDAEPINVTFYEAPTINVTPVPDVCLDSTLTVIPVSGNFGGGASSATWSIITGNGSFQNVNTVGNSVTAEYVPTYGDITAGGITLRLTSDDPFGPCVDVSSNLLIGIDEAVYVVIDQSPSVFIAAGSSANLTATISGAGGTVTTGVWTEIGALTGGTFAPNNLSNTITFTPTAAQEAAGGVTLRLTSLDPGTSCGPAFAEVQIIVGANPVADAGQDIENCEPADSLIYLTGYAKVSAGDADWSIVTGNGVITLQTKTWSAPLSAPHDENDSLLVEAVYKLSPLDYGAPSSSSVFQFLLTTDDPDGAGPVSLDTDDLNYTVHWNPQTPAIGGGGLSNMCVDTYGQFYSVPLTPGNTYVWTVEVLTGGGVPGTDYTISGGGTGFNFIAIDWITEGTYNLKVTETTYLSDMITPCAGEEVVLPIAVYLEPVVTAGSDATICLGETHNMSSTVTDGSGSYLYEWSPAIGLSDYNVPNPVVTGTFTGDVVYFLKITDLVSGCEAVSSTVTITTDPLPIAYTLTGPTYFCDGAVTGVTLTLSDSEADVYYQLMNGAVPVGAAILGDGNPIDWTDNFSGSYYVEAVRDAIPACSQTMAGVVNVTANPAITMITDLIVDVDCFGSNEGEIYISPAGGTAPYSFLWSGPGLFSSTNEDITGLFAGDYTVTITDSRGCTLVSPVITVSEPAQLALTSVLETQAVTCFGGSDGEAEVVVDAASGTAPYNFQWYYDVSLSSPVAGATTSTLIGVPAATYYILVTDAKLCIISGSVVVTQPTEITGSGAQTSVVSCNGNTDAEITITAAGGSGTLEYDLNGANAWQASNIFSGLGAGTYTLRVRDQLAPVCVTSLADILITEPDVLTISGNVTSSYNGAEISCPTATDGIITVVGAGGTAPYQYNIDGGAYQAGTAFGSLGAATYTMGILDDRGCINTVDVTITAPTAISGTAVATTNFNGFNVSCNGAADGIISVTATDGTGTLEYSLDGGAYQLSSVFTGLSGGTYDITVRDENGCTFDILGVVVNEPAAIVASASVTVGYNGRDISCNGASDGEVTATVIGGTGVYTYQWFYDAALSSAVPGGTTDVLAGQPAGTYYVQVTDENACTDNTSITINDTPLLVITPTADVLLTCNGDNDASGTFTITGGTTVYGVVIDDNSSGAAIVINPTDVTFTGGSAGDVTITVTDVNGCIETSTITITEPTAVTASAAVTSDYNGSDVTCFGASNGIVEVTASGGTGALGYVLNEIPANTTGAITGIFSGLPSGTYTFTVTDANSCTTVTAGVTVSDPPQVTASAAITSNYNGSEVSCNGAADGEITVTAAGGTGLLVYTLIEQPGNTTGAASGVFTGVPAGSYTVNVADVNGCSVITAAVVIDNPPSVTGTAAVTSNYNGSDVSCNGASDGEITVTAAGGTGSLAYILNQDPGNVTGAATGVFTGVSAGVYTITITDDNGCNITTPSVVVTNPSAISATASITSNYNGSHVSCNGASDGEITVSAFGGTGALSYVLVEIPGNVTGAVSGVFTGVPAGTYTVTVSDLNGCNVTTGSVTLNDPVVITASAAVTSNYNGSEVSCFGAVDGRITVTASGGTGVLTYLLVEMPANVTGANTGIFSGVPSGSYTITVTDLNSCNVTTAPVTVDDPPAVTATAAITSNYNGSEVSCNGAADGEITVTAAGGTGALIYTLVESPGNLTGASTGIFTGIPAGTYTVRVTDVNGCNITTASVTIDNPPVITATGAVTSTYNGSDVSCFGAADGEITITAAGGTGTLTYVLDQDAANVTGAASGVFTGLIAGSYTVTVTDDNGCNVTTANVVVSNPPAVTATTAVTSSFNGAHISCNGASDGELTVTASGGTGVLSYVLVEIPANVTGAASGIFTGVPAGTYTVSVTDVNLCNVVTTPVTVNEPSVITASAAVTSDYNGSDVTCFGASNGIVEVTASGGTGALGYVLNEIPANTTGAITGIFSGLPSGTYTFTVTDANSCTTVTAGVTVSDPPQVTASAAITSNYNGSEVSCNGAADGEITVTAAGGTGLLVYTLIEQPGNTTGAASGVFTGVPAGSYTVNVADVNGCSVITAAVVIDNPPSVTGTAAVTSNYNGSDVSCNGASDGEITVTAAGGTGSLAYILNQDPGNVTGAATGVFTGVSAGVYTITITDDNGCNITTPSVVVTNPSAISATASITSNYNGSHVSCNGASDGEITVSAFGGTGALSYVLVEIPGNVTGAVSGVFTGVPAGTYTVTVSDLNGCNVTTGSVTLNDPVVITASAAVTSNYNGSEVSCFGAADGRITVTASGGTGVLTYLLVEMPANVTGANTGIFSGVPSGSYTITVTDLNSCNVTTAPVTVDDPPAVTATAAITSNYNGSEVSCNGAADGEITVTAAGGTGALIYTLVESPGNLTGASTGIFTGIPAGTYTVRVTDVNGCNVTTASVTIDNPPVITATGAVTSTYNGSDVSCFGAADGEITITAAGGTGTLTYVLDQDAANVTGAASGVFTGLIAGSYTVTVTDDNGCNVTTANVVVSNPPAVTATTAVTSSFNGAHISCNGASDGELTVTASGGTGVLSYVLVEIPGNVTGAASGIFTGVPAGTYTVSVTDVNSCNVVTTPVTVNEPSVITASAAVTSNYNGSDVTCFGASNGIVEVTASGGTGALGYVLNEIPANTTGAITGIFSGLPSGTYTFTVTDANSCTTVTAGVTVSDPPQVTASAAITSNYNGSEVSCNGAADGEITVTAAGGTGLLVYTLIEQPGNTTGAASGVFTGVPAGSYTVNVADVNGCSVITAAVVIDNPPSVTGTAAVTSNYNGSDVSCNGASDGEITVTAAGGTGSLAYILNQDPGNVTGAATGVFTGVSAGVYTITVTDDNGCNITTPSVVVTNPSAISATASITSNYNGSHVSCNGASDGEITVSAFGGTGALSYVLVEIPGNVTGAVSGVFTGVPSGTYTVTVSDLNGCNVTTGSVTLNDPVVITASAAVTSNYNGSEVSCFGAADGRITVTASGGTGVLTYLLVEMPANVTGANTGIFSGVPSGSYTITVTDLNSCNVTTAPVTVDDPPAVTATAAITSNYNGSEVSCNGAADGEITVTAAGGTGALIYTLVESPGNLTGASTGIFTGIPAGTYTVRVTDVNGCNVTTASVTIDDPPVITATGAVTSTYNGSDVSCFGAADGEITITAAGGTGTLTYVLDQDAANVTGAASGVFTGLIAGSYTVTVTDDNGCNVTTANVVVSNPPAVTATTAVTSSFNGAHISCNGASDGELTVTASGGTGVLSYVLVEIPGNVTGAASGIFTGVPAGTYTVSVTDVNLCNVVTTPVTVNEPSVITASAAVTSDYNGSDVTCFGASDGRVFVTASGGTGALSYVLNEIPANITGAATGVFTGLPSGTYTFTVTDANSCTTVTAGVTINDPPALTVTVNITSNYNGSDISCNGAADGIAEAVVGGGTGAYYYNWFRDAALSIPVGQFTATANNLAAGDYWVRVTDVNSCIIVGTVSLTEPVALVAAETARTDVGCYGEATGSVTVEATALTGIAPYDYSINGGSSWQVSGTFSTLPAGNYIVLARDVNLCTFPVNVTITQPTQLTASLLSFTNVGCNGAADGEVQVEATAGSGTSPYQYSIDGGSNWFASGTFTGLAPGSYTVTVEDDNGCQTDVPVTITEPPVLELNPTSDILLDCFGDTDGTGTFYSVGGTMPYTFTEISNSAGATIPAQGINSQVFFGAGVGEVTFRVTDANGCFLESTITFTEPPILTSGIIGANDTVCFSDDPVALTETTPATGGPGPYTYQWQLSQSDVGPWLNIPGANLVDYDPGPASITQYYRREVRSGICSPEYSNVVVVWVNELPSALLTGGATICPGDLTDLNVILFTGTGPYELDIENHGVVSGYVSGINIPVSPAITTSYKLLRVTDANGCEVLDPSPNLNGSADVIVRALPVITADPIDATVCEYNLVQFDITATGDDLMYQWQVDDGSGWTDLVDGGSYFGATMPTLMIFSATRDLSTNRYRAYATTCSVSDTSGVATLTVDTPPEFISQPSDSTICFTEGATFEVQAQGTGLTYQWFVNKLDGFNFVPVVDDANFSGSDQAILTIVNAQLAFNNYMFRVVVSGTCGVPIYSSFAILHVIQPPAPMLHPVDQAICDGFDTYLSANGSLYNTTMWQVNDGGGWVDITDGGFYGGSTSPILSIIGADTGLDAYQYRMALHGDCDTTYTNPAVLTVWDNPVVDFSAIDPMFACGGIDLPMNGNPTGGSGTYNTHRWTGQVGPLSNFGIVDPVFRTTIPGTYNITYTVTDDNFCVGTGDVAVIVEQPTAIFTADQTSGCEPLEVNFTDLSLGGVVYRWDFGDGTPIDNTVGNTSHTFNHSTGVGLEYFTVTLEVETANGCTDDYSIGITLYPPTNADFTQSADTVCSGEYVVFTSDPGSALYEWTWGDGQADPGSSVANHLYLNNTAAQVTYNVELITTSYYGCKDTIVKPIVVYPMPVPTFMDPPDQVYPDATVTFTNTTSTPGTWNYQWTFGDGNGSTDVSPTHTYAVPGYYDIWLRASNSRCTDSTLHRFNLMPTPPVPDFDSIPGACAPYTVTMTNNSLYADSYVWEFGDGGVSYAENPTYTYLESGTFRITLTVTGPGGIRTLSKLIEVYHTPQAFFQIAPEFVYVDDEKVRCFNLSQGADSYIWEFGDGDTAMVADPFHKYMAEGIYDITLHAYSNNGCYDTYTLSPAVTVEPAGELRFANVFRPNKEGELPGDVGSLSSSQIDMVFFPPVKEQVSEYKLQIFNRAGVLIFQSNDINYGWNGYYKGRLVMQGVYVWYVEGKYANGKPFKKTGDITLLH